MSELITCQECHETCHIIAGHLKQKHPELTLEKYKEKHPLAPTMTEAAAAAIEAQKGKVKVEGTFREEAGAVATKSSALKQFFHDVFGFAPTVKSAMSARGTPIPITVNDPAAMGETAKLIPNIDTEYVYDPELTKTVVMGFEMGIPVYLHGHAGVGKTTLCEQIAARTNRPYTRVQHTANMEEADVEGRWVVNAKGEMEFMKGPLTEAMEQGHVYCADEYDFASPMVTSVYQAVLEGKPLFIKAANLKIVPHPNFRFFACGNTNGAGDESGLYQGTMMQNAANYERFGIVERVNYMPEKSEVAMLRQKSTVSQSDAELIVKFAKHMREAFDKKEIAAPMSPRASLNAARLGIARGDFKYGVTLAYINRLPATSADTAKQVMQRIFG